MARIIDVASLRRSVDWARSESASQPVHPDPISRRRVLQLTGLTGLAVTAGALEAEGSLSFVGDSHRAAFLLGGVEAWVIDPHHFAGRPRLRVSQRKGCISVALQDARYPGTPVRADMVCVCEKRLAGWFADVQMAIGFRAQGWLEPWLADMELLESKLCQPLELLNSGRDLQIELRGQVRASFRRDWSFTFAGARSLRVALQHGDCVSDHATFGLARLSDPSHLVNAGTRRSTFSMSRGDAEWRPLPAARRLGDGVLVAPGNAFDGIRVETEEGRSSAPRAVLVARSSTDASSLAYQPGIRFNEPTGEPLTLPLRDARYALAVEGDRVEESVVAGLGPGSYFLDAGGVLLELRDPEDAAALEWHAEDGATGSLSLLPALASMAAPLRDAVAVPTLSDGSSRIALLGHSRPDTPAESIASVAVCLNDDGLDVCLPNCRVAVLRPADLLQLQFEFVNLRLRKAGSHDPFLERCTVGEAYVVAHFPPQFLAEQAFTEDSRAETQDAPCPDPRPVPARSAGPSRLAFRLPPGMNTLPYSLESLLNWNQLEPELVPASRPTEEIAEPHGYKSAIEVPYRLVLSPMKAGKWLHSFDPVTREGRVEVWHTRLLPDLSVDDKARVVAVWTPDWKSTSGTGSSDPNTCGLESKGMDCLVGNPFCMSLNAQDRVDIVRLSHDSCTKPEPIRADLFMLSGLGAWAELEGYWPDTEERGFTSLEKWAHSITMGREHFAIIERRGFLFPFGHRAVLVTETERRVHEVPAGRGLTELVAYLRIKQYIRVQEPFKDYNTWDMPLVRVTFRESRTPNLDPGGYVAKRQHKDCTPDDKGCCDATMEYWSQINCRAIWPLVGGRPFRFTIDAIDRAGNAVSFKAPVVFVEDGPAIGKDHCRDPEDPDEPEQCAILKDTRCEFLRNDARRSDLESQAVALARSYRKGDTEVEGQWLTFDAQILKYLGPGVPPFRPKLDVVAGRVPAVAQFVTEGDGVVTLGLLDPDENGNAPELFAELKEGSHLDASFHTQRQASGGVVAPTPAITHLSRRFGPVGADKATVRKQLAARGAIGLEPEHFFHKDAAILGQIPLKEIIGALDVGDSASVPALQSLLTEWADGPDQLTQSLNWNTDRLKQYAFGGFFQFKPSQGATLSIDGTFEGWPGTELAPSFRVIGRLGPPAPGSGAPGGFVVALDFGVAGLELVFKSAEFETSSAGGTHFSVDISDVRLTGALAFINALQEFLKKFQQSTGISLEITSRGLLVRLPPIKVPTIEMGMFALQQLNIVNWCRLPFEPAPIEFGFEFARREHPFILNVGPYAGGGFVALVLTGDKNGVRHMAAALEFGAMKTLDFGVANGALYVMGGLYYEMERRDKPEPHVAIIYRAYIRAGGQLHALGLVTMSVELYLALEAGENGRQSYLIGTASFTYSFEISFVRKSFSITYTQRFNGSKGSEEHLQNPESRLQALGSHPINTLDLQPLDSDPCASQPSGSLRFEHVMPLGEWERYWGAFAS